ncbi:X-ray repair cross-complementing protein 5 [Orchesella cincta]|uniref:X-ray repair cross-complementing protein 5 n=1 Tax=Orchesella cincta TaxID=48709 RepID=A0A1D2MS61_ORCCI|nr:X-ray repair cross-complementing protein 5 [Orchesella cincta]
MGSRKPKNSPEDLCAYFVEIKEQDGMTSVMEEYVHLVGKCIEDKIFSESNDHIAICRSDTTSSISFLKADWDALRKGLKALSETKDAESGGIENPISCIDDICNAVIAQAEEDAYGEKKILYFSNLSSYVLNEKEVQDLADKLLQNEIFLSIVLPNKVGMTDIQLQNSKLIKTTFGQEKYESVSFVTNFKKAKCQILNTLSKKIPKLFSWNVPFEITPKITINVGGYVCTRQNKAAEMKKVLIKQVESDKSANGNEPSTSTALVPVGSGNTSSSNAAEKTVVIEVAKKVLEKEIIWTEKDGTVVGDEDRGKGYLFADKIVPYNDLETDESYKSGDKCMKLLVFCPVEKLNPALQCGDGTTLFYPKKDDIRSEVMFKALMQAMVKTNRAAIVRKVYRKNTRAAVGSLVPDMDRQCLVFSELSYADDVSIPQLPVLIKPEDMGDEGNDGIGEKESLIDELIAAKSLSYDFNPLEGPVDPAARNMRDMVSKKVLQNASIPSLPNESDNIEVFFQNLIVSESTLSQIRENFPLKVCKIENERLAGTNIFHKRSRENEIEDADKKPKLELKMEEASMEEDKDEDEINDLLDEL